MDDWKKKAIGSKRRDLFKLCHKKLPAPFYASDADLVLISKVPPGIVAYLDYKHPADSVTFAEVILYNVWMQSAPVYLIQGNDPERGPFDVYQYLGGDYHPAIPTVVKKKVAHLSNWDDFRQWETRLRIQYRDGIPQNEAT